MISYTIEDASGEASGFDYLTLTEIKNYLEIDASTYDDLLTDIYIAVAENLERECANALKNRTVTVQYNKYEKYFALPVRPVTSITSVSYTAEDETSGALIEASGDFNSYGLSTSRTADYVLEFSTKRNKIDIVYNADGSTVPREFKLATLAHMKVIWNDERDFTGELSKVKYPKETIYLINKYKRIVI